MTTSDDALERQIAAVTEKLNRAKRAPEPIRRSLARLNRDVSASKTTQNQHAKLMLSASKGKIADAHASIKLIAKGEGGEEDLVLVIKDSLGAFDNLLSASESIVGDLRRDLKAARRENRELKDRLGDETEKKAQRREAGAIVAKGAVTIAAITGDWVRASVSDGTTTHQVERHGKLWSCSCPAPGDCAHSRAVQLIAYKTPATLVSNPDAKQLAASGAVWIRSYSERESGLAEVAHDGKLYTLAKQGWGGFSCDCGSLNGRCVHGDAVRVVIG